VLGAPASSPADAAETAALRPRQTFSCVAGAPRRIKNSLANRLWILELAKRIRETLNDISGLFLAKSWLKLAKRQVS
jgi:hypothetical protein